jgi:hypothetical protein
MIDTLRKNQEWKRRIPGADRKLDDLEDIANRWSFNDAIAIDFITKFHQDLTQGIEQILMEINKRPIQDSIDNLDMLLIESRPLYSKVSDAIGKLTAIKTEI